MESADVADSFVCDSGLVFVSIVVDYFVCYVASVVFACGYRYEGPRVKTSEPNRHLVGNFPLLEVQNLYISF